MSFLFGNEARKGCAVIGRGRNVRRRLSATQTGMRGGLLVRVDGFLAPAFPPKARAWAPHKPVRATLGLFGGPREPSPSLRGQDSCRAACVNVPCVQRWCCPSGGAWGHSRTSADRVRSARCPPPHPLPTRVQPARAKQTCPRDVPCGRQPSQIILSLVGAVCSSGTNRSRADQI